ncbi:MAG: glycosyltransferase [Candidatus Omnitrophica bacterium]|nr:glycosyltransferase [Candidatus Omnitrophota bacterium]
MEMEEAEGVRDKRQATSDKRQVEHRHRSDFVACRLLPVAEERGQRPFLGVILSQFPRYDEAFILRELVALAQAYTLVIFSLRPCRDRVVHAQAQALQPNTVYCPFAWSAAMWRSHGWFLRRNPRGYAGALWWIVSRHWAHPVILMRSLLLFPKTVRFARLAQERRLPLLHAFWATYPASAAVVIGRLTGIAFSLSGHAHDIYTTNPTLAEKLRRARFVVTCTEANRQHLLALVGNHQSPNPNHQIIPKRQAPIPTFPVESKRSSQPRWFGDWRIGHWSLFGAWNLVFGHSPHPSPLTPHTPEIFLSYHGVDLSKFSPAPKPESRRCAILAVGSLLPCKGYETLIDACALLKARGVDFSCAIAGGGPLERGLRRRIARHNLEGQVTITGYVSQEAVVRLYQQAHLCVLPLVSKIHWGIPNVLIEALATKTPVISCDLPSMAELVESGKSGWMVPEEDPAALASAVESLWAAPQLRARLAEAGYRRVAERFALEQTGEQLRTIFSAHQKMPGCSVEKLRGSG